MENPSEQKEYINYLEKKFDIKQTSDWYSITNKRLKKVISIDLPTTINIVKQFYPEINVENFQVPKSKNKEKIK